LGIIYSSFKSRLGLQKFQETPLTIFLPAFQFPAEHWKQCDSDINALKTKYDLGISEIHTGWVNDVGRHLYLILVVYLFAYGAIADESLSI
jgi:hypothetical protein